eukprot:CAMPEP_0114527234 /NCGR_PEP_ID=MMETSP0109-20121206/23496_1 /TAXON_ID=29199 /ORGANISM="Chlorarachnion reptans, Strain CCCM449" /LENGTH=394 /DNA_ID=CAMNT_0001709163 /DNA_START=407 /DNA_END=1591 /DNA_ORIENTATION=+
MRVFGRVYLAREGWNASLVFPYENLEALRECSANVLPHQWRDSFDEKLRSSKQSDRGVSSDQHRAGYYIGGGAKPAREESARFFFNRLHVRVRAKLVQDGLSPEMDRRVMESKPGESLDPKDWHEALKAITDGEESGLVLDCRNLYESEIGRFENAEALPVNYHRDSFEAIEEITNDVSTNLPVYIYCTGGIRCEKLSKYLKLQGCQNVMQLKGGIYNYLQYANTEGLKGEEMLFKGKVFSFDKRAVVESVSDRAEGTPILSVCHQCEETPADQVTNCPKCGILFIQCDSCKETHNGCCSVECMRSLNLKANKHKSTTNSSIHSSAVKVSVSSMQNLLVLKPNTSIAMTQAKIKDKRLELDDSGGFREYLPGIIRRGERTVKPRSCLQHHEHTK